MPETTAKPGDRRRLTIDAFIAKVESQLGRRPVRESDFLRITFVCPMCAYPQDGLDFVEAGVGRNFREIETQLGFSCIGRWRGASTPRAKPDGKPCDWALEGLFKVHRLELLGPDGKAMPIFELASAPKRAPEASETAA